MEPGLVEPAQDRVRLRQLEIARPELDAIEELVAPLTARAAEQLVVAPDLRLEPGRGEPEPSPRIGDRRELRQGGKVLAVRDDAQVHRNPGVDEAVDPGQDPVERAAPARVRTAAVVDEPRAVERDLDLLDRAACERRQEGLEVVAVRDDRHLEAALARAAEDGVDPVVVCR